MGTKFTVNKGTNFWEFHNYIVVDDCLIEVWLLQQGIHPWTANFNAKRVNTVVILLFWYLLSESHINISQVMQHCLCDVEAFWFLTYLVVYKVILSYSVFQEKTCEESASFDLTSFDIASCIEDIAQCIELIECREQNELAVEEGAGTIIIQLSFT